MARTLERASGIGGGSNAAGPGCKTRFPSRGGVDLLMNSIVVGSLDAACRRTKENKKSVKKKAKGSNVYTTHYRGPAPHEWGLRLSRISLDP